MPKSKVQLHSFPFSIYLLHLMILIHTIQLIVQELWWRLPLKCQEENRSVVVIYSCELLSQLNL